MWKDHQRDGQGKYIFPDGTIYEGMWKDHKKNG
jgi:hypothetical protein